MRPAIFSTLKNFFTLVWVVAIVFFGIVSNVQAAKLVEDQVGLGEVLKDECADQNTCIGWNYCSAVIKRDGAPDRIQEFVSFNQFQNVPLFKVFQESIPGKPYNRYTVNFNCNTEACGFNVSDIQWYGGDRTQDFIGSCKYENPFCCCALNSKGRLEGCSRAVDYGNGPEPVPTCGAFGTQYRPFTEKTVPQYGSTIAKGAGCQAFQDAINKAEDAKAASKPAPLTQSSINLKQSAASLNQSKFTSAEQVIGQIVKIMLSFVGSIALALYIGAGILWMTALGNSERIDKAKSIFVWTTLGLVIMLASYFIVQFLFTTLNV